MFDAVERFGVVGESVFGGYSGFEPGLAFETSPFDPVVELCGGDGFVDGCEHVEELVAGVEVAFGCGLASGGFDVDGLVAGGAAGGLVVGVGEECGVAGAGCAVVVAADDGWAWADEVFFGGVDCAVDFAGFFGGSGDVGDVVVELVSAFVVEVEFGDVGDVGVEPACEVCGGGGVERCGLPACGADGDGVDPVLQGFPYLSGGFGGVEVDCVEGVGSSVSAYGAEAYAVELLDAVVEFLD